MNERRSLNLSVTQKVLVSAAFIVVPFLIGMAVTALFIPWLWAVAIWIGGLALIVIGTESVPLFTGRLISHPNPCKTFDEARSRFEGLIDEAPVHERCHAYLLDHGRRVEKAYVLIHGISNCPYSMIDFAPLLKARGANVLVTRMPQNGHADNATAALKNLTAESLRDFADTSIDIAAGLGERVVVIGISAGGVVAGWIAQNRSEIDRALLLAPAYGLSSMGTGRNIRMTRLVLRLPNFSVWKDPILRAAAPSRPHSYKRQSTWGIGQVMRLGIATYRQAEQTRAAARAVTVVTNASDTAVDIGMIDRLVAAWKAKGVPVTEYRFPKEADLPHELLDPTEEGANPAMVYPKIIELAGQPAGVSTVVPAA